jgi:hypothetical protein
VERATAGAVGRGVVALESAKVRLRACEAIEREARLRIAIENTMGYLMAFPSSGSKRRCHNPANTMRTVTLD